jgi:hypothetical protein
MSSPVANVPSPPTFYPDVKSTVLSTDSPSTPSSYVSLLDTSQSLGSISCSIILLMKLRTIFK